MKGIHCAFVGFATDAEIKPRKSKTGTEYLVLSVYRAGDETEDRELIWVRTWQNVDQLVQTVKPSCQLYIEGIVTIARWTDKHGADRSALSVNASKIEVFPVREAVVMAAAPKATKAKKAADSTPALSEQPPAARPATPTPADNTAAVEPTTAAAAAEKPVPSLYTMPAKPQSGKKYDRPFDDALPF